MEKVKIIAGLIIIVLSFVYILKNNTSMLDNVLSKTKQEYERQQAIKDNAHKVVNGEEDAFDTIVKGVKCAVKPATDRIEDLKKKE